MAMPTATGLVNTGVVSDPIADMLTRIRNANKARRSEVYVPASKLKQELARVLTEEGYLASYEVERPADSPGDRKSTRLNFSHQIISYAVFCLKKKKNTS